MKIIKLTGKDKSDKVVHYEYDADSEPIGVGGIGKVYKGVMTLENGQRQNVAIKQLYDDLPLATINRAMREASIQIRHDNLVEMKGFIVHEDKTDGRTVQKNYVISEYLVGITLDELLSCNLVSKKGETIKYAQELYDMYKTKKEEFAITIMRKVLSGIMALHDYNYIHRDIDPTNIMVTQDGKVKLIDFGIAKMMDNIGTTDKNLTLTGQFIGKPHYAAPELVLGDVKMHNYTTDIYALGVLFFQLVTGDLPFKGSTTKVLNDQLRTKMPVNSVSNPFFADVIQKATNKEQSDRYQSTAEFRVAIDHLKEKIGLRRHWWKSKEAKIFSGVLVVVAAVVCAVFLLPTHNDSPDPHPEPLVPFPLVHSFEQIKDSLYDVKTSKAYLDTLISHAETDIPCAFLYSRLFFSQKRPHELTDTIIQIQRNLQGILSQDNKTAHQMLLKVLEMDAKDYRALYEMGQDYFRDDRGVNVDFDKAKAYFERSKEYALVAGDTLFVLNYVQPALNNW